MSQSLRHYEASPPAVLYHYTDGRGLLGILASRTLWATHYEYLNDSREFTYARGVLKQVAAEAARDARDGSARALLSREILDSDASGRGILDLYNDVDTADVRLTQLLACFSENPDDLSQWRGYAKGIGGYALGFTTEALLDTVRRLTGARFAAQRGLANARIEVRARLLRCEYDGERQQRLMRDAFEKLVQDCDREGYALKEVDIRMLQNSILRPLAPVYKHPAFESEHEWRLVISVVISKQPSGGESSEAAPPDAPELFVQFRSGEYTLIPYVALPMGAENKRLIKEVIVGPTPLPELAWRSTAALLRSHDIGQDRIRSSTAPFRRV